MGCLGPMANSKTLAVRLSLGTQLKSWKNVCTLRALSFWPVTSVPAEHLGLQHIIRPKPLSVLSRRVRI